MSHNTGWTITAGGQLAERIPRVSGAFWFALPFPADTHEDVEWADYFAGPHARAFLVGKRPVGHPRAGTVYPLDLEVVNGNDDNAAAAEIANFIGVQVDGENYEISDDRTVTLAGGIPLKYVQQIQTGDNAVDPYTVDPAVTAAAPLLGMKIYNGHLFWNTVQ